MAKVVEFEYDALVTRDNNGHVSIEVDKATGVEKNKGEEVEVEAHQVIGFSKEISDFNQKELLSAKQSLFMGEDERAVKVIEKKLVG